MEHVLAFWRALDDRFERVTHHPWGAVVTDGRFPDIWDVNYARVERMVPGLTLAGIEAALDPALDAVGAVHRHLVLFDPDEMAPILSAASTRGAVVSWDAVLTLGGEDLHTRRDEPPIVEIEEVRAANDRFLAKVRSTMVEFDVRDPRAEEELMGIERTVLLPAGKRWFRIVADGRTAALGSILRIGDDALIDHVVTLPFARRRGYAAAIVDHMATDAARSGVRLVTLLTEPGGAAERLYQRLGFGRVRTIASIRERRDRTVG